MSSKSASRFEPLEGDARSAGSRSRLRALAALLVLTVAVWFLARGTALRPPGRPAPEPSGAGSSPRAVFRPLELAREDEEPEGRREPSGEGAARTYAFSPLAAQPVPLAGRRIEVLAGRVVGLGGRGVAGARAASGSHAAVTDREGRFALPRTFGPVSVEHPEHFPRTLEGGAFPVNVARVSEGGPAAPFLLVCEVAPEELEIVLRPGSRISGTVRDERGNPVAGARVQFGEDEGAPEAASGPDGSYASPLLRHGILRVSLSHPEYQPATETVTIRAPGLTARCEFTLVRGDRLTVRARDPSGQPVAGASVWIRFGGAAPPPKRRPGDPVFASPPEETGHGEWRYLGRTDDLGTLETRRDPARAAAVRVADPEHAEEVAAVTGDEVALVLRPAPAVEGDAVESASGLPLKIVGVRLFRLRGSEYEETSHRGARFASLEKGKFVVGLPPVAGTYRVAVEAEGDYRGFSAPFAFDGERAPPPVLVRLEFRLELRGFVRGPEGPIAGVEVELLPSEEAPPEARRIFGVPVPGAPPPVQVARTEEDGRFCFSNLRPGAYRLRVSAPGRALFLSPPLEPPWEGDYPVILEPGARLDGSIEGPAGDPQSDVPVVLVGEDGTARFDWTDGDGRFRFADLRPGAEYRLFVADPREPGVAGGGSGAPEPKAHRVEIPKEGACAVHIRSEAPAAGSVYGRLALEGRPLPGVPLRLKPAGLGAPASAAPEPATTGPDGTFAWRGLAPGTYRIEADAPLEGVVLPGASEVVVRAGRRTPVEASVRGLAYEIRLADPTGRPLETPALVECRRAGGEPEADGGADVRRALSASGRVRFSGLLPGSYAVSVRVDGYLVAERVRSLRDDAEETLAVPPLKTVRVRVQAESGTPFRGTALVVVRRDGREVYRGTRPIDGGVDVAAAGPGDYEVTIRTEEGIARAGFRWTGERASAEPRPRR